MKFNMTTPCTHCPFLATVPGYLQASRVHEIISALLMTESVFPCHKTITFGNVRDNGHWAPNGTEEHCAGALIFLELQESPSQMMRIAERLGRYDRHALNMDAPVFSSQDDMAAHHGGNRNGS